MDHDDASLWCIMMLHHDDASWWYTYNVNLFYPRSLLSLPCPYIYIYIYIYTAVVVLVPDSKVITQHFVSLANMVRVCIQMALTGNLDWKHWEPYILMIFFYKHVFVSSLRSVCVSYPGALPILRSSCIPLCSIYVPMHSICVPLLSIWIPLDSFWIFSVTK